MKYMGSKRMMLPNGLGTILNREAGKARRFIDLFAGSGVVAIHVARQFPIRVLAVDLQSYSAVLAGAVVKRHTRLNWQPLWISWHRRAEARFNRERVPTASKLTQRVVTEFRTWCSEQAALPITKAYGGHYFSPKQAVWIDALRASLPDGEPAKTAALAALIQAASQCAAAPGHTAQPFQPTRTAKLFLSDAWNRDIVQRTKDAYTILAGQFAKQRGEAKIADANKVAAELREGDLVFIDPPYSGVHYSRFYHVLETIAHGNCGEVSGIGRYPVPKLRPRSRYSLITESKLALDELLKTVASRRAKAVLTFPSHKCSNGLSGKLVFEIAAKYFHVQSWQVKSKFSTLGGTGDKRGNEAGRSSHQRAKELILVLKPRKVPGTLVPGAEFR